MELIMAADSLRRQRSHVRCLLTVDDKGTSGRDMQRHHLTAHPALISLVVCSYIYIQQLIKGQSSCTFGMGQHPHWPSAVSQQVAPFGHSDTPSSHRTAVASSFTTTRGRLYLNKLIKRWHGIIKFKYRRRNWTFYDAGAAVEAALVSLRAAVFAVRAGDSLLEVQKNNQKSQFNFFFFKIFS